MQDNYIDFVHSIEVKTDTVSLRTDCWLFCSVSPLRPKQLDFLSGKNIRTNRLPKPYHSNGIHYAYVFFKELNYIKRSRMRWYAVGEF